MLANQTRVNAFTIVNRNRTWQQNRSTKQVRWPLPQNVLSSQRSAKTIFDHGNDRSTWNARRIAVKTRDSVKLFIFLRHLSTSNQLCPFARTLPLALLVLDRHLILNHLVVHYRNFLIFKYYLPITYYWTVLLILDHSYLVGRLRSSKITDTKVSGF